MHVIESFLLLTSSSMAFSSSSKSSDAAAAEDDDEALRPGAEAAALPEEDSDCSFTAPKWEKMSL